ncbi:MAG: hypothetical protein IPK80_00165 [Nannocystis sp.]|nr:hypothetical protein [Nannocystis sp.]
MARVSHPNVAAVYRVGEAEGRPYIAYEYLDGPTLARVARPMPWRQVLELGLGLARGSPRRTATGCCTATSSRRTSS